MSGISLPKAYFIAMFCEAILHGAYTVLTGGALYLLLNKRRPQRMARTNIIMIVLTVLMYCMSTVHIALALRVNLIAFFEQHAIEGGTTILDDQGSPLVWVQIGLELLNCLLGDSIVCWRTWVLYSRNWKILIFPATCIVGGLVSGIGMTIALARSPPGGQLFSGSITLWFAFFGVLTCIANLYSVAMIAWKAWTNARTMRAMKVIISGGTYVSAVLLIVESGAIYCVALIITVALFLVDNNGVYIIADMLNHLTGIYPTIIIVLICLQITLHDDMSRVQTLSSGRGTSGVPSTVRTGGSNTVLTWRPTKRNMGTESFATNQTSSAYKMQPIQIATTTEHETWHDGAYEPRGYEEHVLDKERGLPFDDNVV
ncbi:uncharacterized protein BXZ73DRAFT_101025 [Epithele typhae]|uniref:uncharacterized protein n=1 Tax=Epithele typhae TaxID=378194 RepID=UPI002007598A|nr:uncharacterized protein BXZ73DRAFT_101025 [Epithele typhae]KAH9933641.1 hypothetical protein BXZ73DRAFT_101025 [Epithele typhae]